jgi:hypothetical protein
MERQEEYSRMAWLEWEANAWEVFQEQFHFLQLSLTEVNRRFGIRGVCWWTRDREAWGYSVANLVWEPEMSPFLFPVYPPLE